MQKKHNKNISFFHDKSLNKLFVEGIYLNILKAKYNKLTADIILNTENLKTLLLRSRATQGCLLSLYLFNIVSVVLANKIREENEVKGIQTEKEEVNYLIRKEEVSYINSPGQSFRMAIFKKLIRH